jgi:hypothetical protein
MNQYQIKNLIDSSTSKGWLLADTHFLVSIERFPAI